MLMWQYVRVCAGRYRSGFTHTTIPDTKTYALVRIQGKGADNGSKMATLKAKCDEFVERKRKFGPLVHEYAARTAFITNWAAPKLAGKLSRFFMEKGLFSGPKDKYGVEGTPLNIGDGGGQDLTTITVAARNGATRIL